MPEADLYEQIIEVVDSLYGAHPEHRALHTKGSWCEGTFTATPAAGELSPRVPPAAASPSAP